MPSNTEAAPTTLDLASLLLIFTIDTLDESIVQTSAGQTWVRFVAEIGRAVRIRALGRIRHRLSTSAEFLRYSMETALVMNGNRFVDGNHRPTAANRSIDADEGGQFALPQMNWIVEKENGGCHDWTLRVRDHRRIGHVSFSCIAQATRV